jgi:hypothetical protein
MVLLMWNRLLCSDESVLIDSVQQNPSTHIIMLCDVSIQFNKFLHGGEQSEGARSTRSCALPRVVYHGLPWTTVNVDITLSFCMETIESSGLFLDVSKLSSSLRPSRTPLDKILFRYRKYQQQILIWFHSEHPLELLRLIGRS